MNLDSFIETGGSEFMLFLTAPLFLQRLGDVAALGIPGRETFLQVVVIGKIGDLFQTEVGEKFLRGAVEKRSADAFVPADDFNDIFLQQTLEDCIDVDPSDSLYFQAGDSRTWLSDG